MLICPTLVYNSSYDALHDFATPKVKVMFSNLFHAYSAHNSSCATLYKYPADLWIFSFLLLLLDIYRVPLSEGTSTSPISSDHRH